MTKTIEQLKKEYELEVIFEDKTKEEVISLMNKEISKYKALAFLGSLYAVIFLFGLMIVIFNIVKVV